MEITINQIVEIINEKCIPFEKNQEASIELYECLPVETRKNVKIIKKYSPTNEHTGYGIYVGEMMIIGCVVGWFGNLRCKVL